MSNKKSSIKFRIVLLFCIIIFSSLFIADYLIFYNWNKSTDQLILRLENEANEEIFEKLENYFDLSLFINEVSRSSIESGTIDFSIAKELETFFAGIVKSSNETLYSTGYGNEMGEYLGARRNSAGHLEITKTNEETEWKAEYYSVNIDLSAGEMTEQLGTYDPRTRPWYITAKENKTQIFSPIYKHFAAEDLAITVADPIYDKNGALQGVLGTHLVLSTLNKYLIDIVDDKNIEVYIFEKNSGEMVANSLYESNFTTSTDGMINRIKFVDMKNTFLVQTYEEMKSNSENRIVKKSAEDKYHIKLVEYQKNGLNWMVITSIPESFFKAEITESFVFSLFITGVILIFAIFLWVRSLKIFFDPIYSLINVTKEFANGNLHQRANVYKNDEIGQLSNAFNNMADELNIMVDNLEENVIQRTLELDKANDLLNETSERLKITLFSIGDAFISTDRFGKIVMINVVALNLTDWSQEDAIGKSLADVFVLEDEVSGEKSPSLFNKLSKLDECKEDECPNVLRSKLGKKIPVEYNATPILDQLKSLAGVIVIFRDCTEKRAKLLEIEALSFRDALTGLYNRRFYDEELKRLDIQRNLPLTLIMGDVNGLKLTNDVFGHHAGDKLLKKISMILLDECRKDEIIARIGGDEFAIILPQTDEDNAAQLINRIKAALNEADYDHLALSISIGRATKKNEITDINRIFEAAEEDMYRHKLIEGPLMQEKTLTLIMNLISENGVHEKEHSTRVSAFCEAIAISLGMHHEAVIQIKKAGLMHDVGDIILSKEITNKKGLLNEHEWAKVKSHSEIGYRILNANSEFASISEYVLQIHERWDGLGYPKGLIGENIKIQSRIIAIADAYVSMTDKRSYREIMSFEDAIKELRKNSGTQFDPNIVEVFINKVLNS